MSWQAIRLAPASNRMGTDADFLELPEEQQQQQGKKDIELLFDSQAPCVQERLHLSGGREVVQSPHEQKVGIEEDDGNDAASEPEIIPWKHVKTRKKRTPPQ